MTAQNRGAGEVVSVTAAEADAIIREWGCGAEFPIECPLCGAFFAPCKCSDEEMVENG